MEKIIKPVFWTTRALKDLEKTTRFNESLYGFTKAIEILENSNFSEIGSVDEDFLHLKRKYRKLIHLHCKITYRESQTKIYINRVFDTWQNPNKNK